MIIDISKYDINSIAIRFFSKHYFAYGIPTQYFSMLKEFCDSDLESVLGIEFKRFTPRITIFLNWIMTIFKCDR